jgi:hypothetical protein
LVYGISQANVEATICQGKILMWNGELLLDIDEQEVKARQENWQKNCGKGFDRARCEMGFYKERKRLNSER